MADRPEPAGASNAGNIVAHPALGRQAPNRLLHRLWQQWRSFAVDRLRQLLLDIDDDLFARADAAENGAMQELYFNAMRLLRYQTDLIRDRFAEAIDAPVPEFMEGKGSTGAAPVQADEEASLEQRLEELSLMDEEVLEQRLAVATMTQRFERAHSLEVLLAQRRLEALRQEASDRSSQYDFNARRLAEAFAGALAPLDLDLRIRLLLFKHFELQVMEPLADLLRQFNSELVAAGILPKLDLSAERAAATQAPAPHEHSAALSEPAATAHQGNPSQAAAPAEGAANVGVPSAATSSNLPGGQPSPLPALSLPPGIDLDVARERRQSLMRKLPALSQQRRFAGGNDPTRLLDVAMVLNLLQTTQRSHWPDWQRDSLEQLPARLDFGALLLDQAQRQGHEQAALQGADEDTVNLLQMLFDLILDDDNLAIPMRALIARLQLPMLRVALLDAGFFSSGKHPARRFLNAISRAGIGWSQAAERSKDRLYAGLEALVNRAGSEFDGDPALFDRLCRELDSLLAEETERVKKAEAKVVAQEQARIAADRTRLIITRLIEHRLASAPDLPQTLHAFITQSWQQVLMRAHGQPAAWKDAFAVLRRLTGSSNGLDGAALHQALTAGLELLAIDSADASRQAADILGLWVDYEAEAPAFSGEGSEGDPEQELAVITTAAAQDEAPRADDPAPPSSAAMAAAQDLAEQSWVELQTRIGKVLRCRLATVTSMPERCIFLNRRGLRIETLSRLEIARAIDAGRLRILDDRQLFDRALERVIGGLRQEQVATSSR